jgi:hypothetical protein
MLLGCDPKATFRKITDTAQPDMCQKNDGRGGQSALPVPDRREVVSTKRCPQLIIRIVVLAVAELAAGGHPEHHRP